MKTVDSQLTNPFPGLRPFRSDEHHLFFGREEQTAALVQLLRTNRFLAVVGTSGSGKSSLVRAGMIAELHGGTMTQAGSAWEVMILRPGGSPIENLALAFVEAELYDPEDPSTLPRLLATLNRSRFGLVEAMKQCELSEPGANLLVVVDQFEELFRFRQQGVDSEEAAAAFVNLLLTASEQAERPIYVTITMRSDYLGDCSEIAGLAEAVNDGEYLIPRLLRDQKRDAIEKPIGVGGAKISPMLVQRLLNDVGDDPDQLPVLQHALLRMWDAWSGRGDHDRPIDFADFEVTGGLGAALSNHADEIYDSLPSDRHRSACEKIFKTLTVKGDDNRGIRRPTRLAQLQAIADADRDTVTTVLDAFRGSGVTFLMPGKDVQLTDQTVLDLSHESLMRGWQRLRMWVEEEAQSARIFRRLLDTARLWGDGKAGLFRDPDLQIAISWRNQEAPNTDWAEQYGGDFESAIGFLEASNAEAEAERHSREAARQRELDQARQLAEAQRLRLDQQRRAAHRLRLMIAGLAAVALVAGVACVAALLANQRAVKLAFAAQQNEVKARQNAKRAELSQQETANALAVVESQEKAGRWLLYATDMQLVPFIWKNPQATAAQLRSRLFAHDPVHNESLAGKEDMRGFEWYYYQHLMDASAAVFSGHGASVIDGAFTPDGQLVTLDHNSQVRRWYLDSQAEDEGSRRDLSLDPSALGRFGPGSLVRTLAPNGRLTALAEGKTVRVVETSTGKETLKINSNFVFFRHLIFSQGGDRLVIVDDKIRWLNTSTGEVLASLDRNFGRAESVAVSADGLTLAVVGHGNLGELVSSFRLDAAAKTLIPLAKDVAPDLSETLGASALSPDGGRIAIGAKLAGALFLLETATGRLVAHVGSAHASHVSAVNFSSDGAKLATADVEGTIKIWADAGKLSAKSAATLTLKGHQGAIHALHFSTDGHRLVTSSADKTARVWNLEDAGAAIRPLERLGPDCRVARFSPDGQVIAAAAGAGARLWDAATGRPVRELPAVDKGRIQSVAFSPTDSRLLALGYGGRADVSYVALWDIDAVAELARLPGSIDLTGLPVNEFTGAVGALAFSPDGKYLVAGFGSKSVLSGLPVSLPLKVWEVATRRLIRRLDGHSGHCVSLDFSRDGTLLASGSHDGKAIIWSTETWKPTQTLQNPDKEPPRPGEFEMRGAIEDVAFSPDGTILAMCSRAGNLQLWDIASGQLLGTLKGHSSAVSAVVFSPDGRTMASCSEDQTVRLWNVQTRRELMQLDPGKFDLGGVRTLAFSPSGEYLLAAGHAGAFWSTAPIVWNDSGLAAEKLRLLLRSNANFQSRIRMLSENLPLHEALEKLDGKDVRVQAALAATQANWHASRHAWPEAVAAFDRLVAADSREPQAWLRTPGLLRLATALLQQNRAAAAAMLLQGGAARRTEDGLPAISQANRGHDATGELFFQLLAALEKRLVKDPRDAALHELRAELAGQESDFARQAADYTKAIKILAELKPDDAISTALRRLYHRRGDAFLRLQQAREAVADYDHCITPETTDALLLSNRARAHEAQQNWDAAASDWSRAATGNPGGPRLLAEFAARLAAGGQVGLARGQYEKCIALYERSLETAPDSDSVAAELTRVLLDQQANATAALWTVLKPTEMKSEGGATLALQRDGSILAGGENPARDVYTLVARPGLERINAIRLEAIPDPSLPHNGPGRAVNGNFHLNELRVSSGGKPSKLTNILVNYDEIQQSRAVIDGKIDEALGWSNGFKSGAANTAIVATHLQRAPNDDLRIELYCSQNRFNPRHNLGRFRLSVCGDPAVFDREQKRLAVMQLTNPQEALAAAYALSGRFEAAVAIQKKLVDADPTSLVSIALADSYYNFGNLLIAAGKPAEALASLEAARAIRQTWAAANPVLTDFQSALAASQNSIGRLHAREKRFAEALTTLDASVAIRRKLAESDPKNTAFASDLGLSYACRGEARVCAGQPAEAAADLQRALESWAKVSSPSTETRFEQARALALLAKLGKDAKSGVAAPAAASFADQTVTALREAIEDGWAQRDELKRPDFDLLRDRADFQKLASGLDKKSPPP
jgi:WD40 repeat protein/tetratricopeptide (TPR) repeat protein